MGFCATSKDRQASLPLLDRESAVKPNYYFKWVQSFQDVDTYLTSQDFGGFDAVLADLPRMPDTAEDPVEARRWLHRVGSLLDLAREAIGPEGVVVLESDDAGLPAVCLAARAAGLHIHELAAWKKKYSVQHDRRAVVHGLHDWILALRLTPPVLDAAFWYVPWEVAGKSEDARRGFIRALPGVDPPAALKPTKLYAWIRGRHLSDVRSVLDLTAQGASASSQFPVDVRRVDLAWVGSDAVAYRDLTNLRLKIEVPPPPPSPSGPEDEVQCLCSLDLTMELGPTPRARVAIDGEEASDGAAILTGRDAETAAAVRTLLSGALEYLRIPAETFLAAPRSWLAGLRPTGVSFLETTPSEIPELYAADCWYRWCGTLLIVEDESTEGPCRVLAVAAREPELAIKKQHGPAKRNQYPLEPSDPRGPSRDAGFKGARTATRNLIYSLQEPPYEWEVVSGQLPDGLWRLNASTGAIWGRPTRAGEWTFDARVTDADGNSTTEPVVIVVEPSASDRCSRQHGSLAWLEESLPQKPEEPLRLSQNRFCIPLHESCSIVLNAVGGCPRVSVIDPPGKATAKGQTRGWAMTLDTLRERIREDVIAWKAGGRPTKRIFAADEDGTPSPLKSIQLEDLWAVLYPVKGMEAQVNVVAPQRCEVSVWSSRDHRSNPSSRWTVAECPACEGIDIPGGCTTQHAIQDLGLVYECDDEVFGMAAQRGRDLLGFRRALVVDGPVTDETISALLRQDASLEVVSQRVATTRSAEGRATRIRVS
jgi:hypothetical protein